MVASDPAVAMGGRADRAYVAGPLPSSITDVAALIPLAESLGAAAVAGELQRLVTRVRDGRVYLACLGQFTGGKATATVRSLDGTSRVTSLDALAGAGAAAMGVLPWLTPRFFRAFGGRPSELEAKFLLLVLFGLGALATWADSEAVLPAYLVGMVLAGTVGKDHALIRRLRTVTFGLLTPFYFIRAGALVSVSALVAAPVSVLGLLAAKLISKSTAARWSPHWLPTPSSFRDTCCRSRPGSSRARPRPRWMGEESHDAEVGRCPGARHASEANPGRV